MSMTFPYQSNQSLADINTGVLCAGMGGGGVKTP